MPTPAQLSPGVGEQRPADGGSRVHAVRWPYTGSVWAGAGSAQLLGVQAGEPLVGGVFVGVDDLDVDG